MSPVPPIWRTGWIDASGNTIAYEGWRSFVETLLSWDTTNIYCYLPVRRLIVYFACSRLNKSTFCLYHSYLRSQGLQVENGWFWFFERIGWGTSMLNGPYPVTRKSMRDKVWTGNQLCTPTSIRSDWGFKDKGLAQGTFTEFSQLFWCPEWVFCLSYTTVFAST
jgi:hypothetical protein